MAAFDPEPIPDYGQRVEIGRDLLLDELPAREEGKGYVSVAESSFVWKKGKGLGVKTFEELTTDGGPGPNISPLPKIWLITERHTRPTLKLLRRHTPWWVRPQISGGFRFYHYQW